MSNDRRRTRRTRSFAHLNYYLQHSLIYISTVPLYGYPTLVGTTS